MLNCSDLRNTVTAIQTPKMSSAYNLKVQCPTPQPNSKESNATVTKTVFQCHACQKEFITEKYLCMHMALHRAHGTSATSSVASTISSSTGTKHMGSKGASQTPSDDSIKLVKSDGTGGSHWTCKICSKTFAQSSNYKNHIRTHSDERPFVCNICSIGFKERYHLKKHILFKHSDELKEECRVCGKRFKDSTAVRAHERIHSEERPYGCQRCDKTFKTSECLWHHENRSRTCGKSSKGAVDANGMAMNPGPRFRRGRHPSKRIALNKMKVVSEGVDDPIGDVSASLNLDHVEEISASVKIELEREIPDYYFIKAVPDLCNYEFETMMDVLSADASMTIEKEALFPRSHHSAKSTDAIIDKPSDSEVNALKSSLCGVVATNVAKPLDPFSTPFWGNEWTSTGAGVLLGSPSRPVSASYDIIGDAYRPETPDNSWKQELSNCHGMYTGDISKPDLVKSPEVNLTHYSPQQNVRQIQLPAMTEAVSSANEVLPYGELDQLGNGKSDVSLSGSMQTQMLQARCSYANDFCSNEKVTRSIMDLTSMTETQLWPNRSMESVSSGRVLDRSSEFTLNNTCSYPVSIASVPTAVVAPFKRENTARSLEVSISETDQPVKNSLPPFETFAPITLRVQKSQHVMPKVVPCASPDTRSYPSLSGPYSFDGSVANQCPTIQKYLLRGHPNASIKINYSLPGKQVQRGPPLGRQCHRLSPRDKGRHLEISSSLVPLETDHFVSGHHQLPEFRGFVSETQMKASVGQRELIALPSRATDATCALNFIQMAPGSYSQSAILQPLNDIGESNAMPVNLYQQL